MELPLIRSSFVMNAISSTYYFSHFVLYLIVIADPTVTTVYLYIETVAKREVGKIGGELYYVWKKKTKKHQSEQAIKPDFSCNWPESRVGLFS